MIQITFLAFALFLAIEGAIVVFWPAWAKKKMADMQDVPDRALGIIGLLFIASGVVVAGLTDGIIKIAAVAVALEGTLYGFLPTLMKRVMAAAVQCSESMLKVWGETALGIGAAALALFY